MKIGVIFVLSHDSIGLGEDGPTHQPVEQLSGLRSIPNLNVFEPADTTEVAKCWQIAFQNSNTKCNFSRQKLVQLENNSLSRIIVKAVYEIMRTGNDIKCTIFFLDLRWAWLSEVGYKKPQEIYSKIISVPCLDIFEKILKNKI